MLAQRSLGVVVAALLLVDCRNFSDPARDSGITSGSGGESGSGMVVSGGGGEAAASAGDPTGGVGVGGDAGGHIGVAGGAGAVERSSGGEAQRGGGGAGEVGGAGDAEPGAGGAEDHPYCSSTGSSFPHVGVTAAEDVAVAATQAGFYFALFMSQPVSDIVAVTWSVNASWVPWVCFDTVHDPVRIAAGNWLTGDLQVYAATRAGNVHVRQQDPSSVWKPWVRVEMPVQRVADIATVDADESYRWLYVAAEEGIFRRKRTADESLSVQKLPWERVTDLAARRVAARPLELGHYWIMVGEDGRMSEGTFLQGEGPPVRSDVGEDGRFIDVDIATDAMGRTKVFALRSDGEILSKVYVTGTWQAWSTLPLHGHVGFKTLAAVSQVGGPPALFAIGRYGLPQFSLDGGLTWLERVQPGLP